MPQFTPKEERLMHLAFKGGKDAELFILGELEKVEDKMDALYDRIEKAKVELKELIPDLDKVLESVRGTQGPQGDKGDKPSEGEILSLIKPLIPDPIPGKPGPKGDTVVGPPGPKGDTVIGPPGPPGKDGKDADEKRVIEQLELDLPKLGDRIRDGLELLQGDERLDSSAIKGLEDELKKLRESIISTVSRIGGGGGKQMRISTFSFNGNGSTTTFTLPKEPAAKGKALWIYLQGQALQPTSQYTLAGKTVTTLFTAPIGTIIDGFLINF